MKYSIVIPTYNKVGELRECINSIQKYTDLSKGDIEIIVVSNGCKDWTTDYVQSLGEPFRLVAWHKPLGYTRATNVGISLADGEYVVLWNNDNVLLDWAANNNWLNILEEPFKRVPTAGIVGVAKEWRGGIPWLLFFCVMIKRNIFTKIGLLDEIFSPGAGEDTDFCLRATKAGYTCHQVPVEMDHASYSNSYPLYHKGSLTMNELPNKTEVYSRNEQVLRQRYGLSSFSA